MLSDYYDEDMERAAAEAETRTRKKTIAENIRSLMKMGPCSPEKAMHDLSIDPSEWDMYRVMLGLKPQKG